MNQELRIKNLKVESIDGQLIIDNLSLTINSGEIHIIMGPNGAGKSSLLNAILGHPKFKIISGSILFNGEEITNLSTDKKAKLGLFLSMQHLPEIEGVTVSSFLHKAYKNFKNEEMSIIDFYKYLEDKTKSLNIDSKFLSRYINVGFSGGEKKQGEALQLAVLKPTFAFLDEIDSGVDIDSLNKVIMAIKETKKEGAGFLLVTHYDKLLSKIKPDFVHVIDQGKIVKSGGSELAEEIHKSGFNI